ncbi:uncharacterized protein LOC143248774 isoform X1 [Tachypleus tridentatus]|uniref:uncharacterized protein LOC143248774 isoform X1 n=1 Tax=Tachypleus tridentatus TaxID=6853 RepID=UPI003FD49011
MTTRVFSNASNTGTGRQRQNVQEQQTVVKTSNLVKTRANYNRNNLLHKLTLLQIHGNLQGHARGSHLKLFERLPRRLAFRLVDLVTESVLQSGHVFLGFTKNGQFLLSYTLHVVADDHTAFPYNIYRLHWWLFVPYRPLLKVSEVRLFGETEIMQDLKIAVCQWPTDDTKILVYGCCFTQIQDTVQCYLTITATPPLQGCEECKQLQTQDQDDDEVEEDASFKRCLQHSMTIHTNYILVPPFPPFSPSLCMKKDGLVLINTGDNLIALEVELIRHNSLGFKSRFEAENIPTTSFHHAGNYTEEVSFGHIQLSVPSDEEDSVSSPVGYCQDNCDPSRVVCDLSSALKKDCCYESQVCREDCEARRCWNYDILPCRCNVQHFRIVSNCGENVCNIRSEECNVAKTSEPLLGSKQSVTAQSDKMENCLTLFSSCQHQEFKCCAKLCLHGESSQKVFCSCQWQQENSGEESEDQVFPLHLEQPKVKDVQDYHCVSATRHRWSEKSNKTTDASLGMVVNQSLSPKGLEPSERFLLLRPPSDDNSGSSVRTYLSLQKNSGTNPRNAQSPANPSSEKEESHPFTPTSRGYLISKSFESVKENISPNGKRETSTIAEKQEKAGKKREPSPPFCDSCISAVKQGRPPRDESPCSSSNLNNGRSSGTGGHCVKETRQIFSQRKVNRYRNEEDSSEEEAQNSEYHSSLPLEVHGTTYQPLESGFKGNIMAQDELIVAVRQVAFDIEQFAHEMAQRLCAEAGRKYLAFNDYDVQVIDLCPESQTAVVLVLMLIQATVGNKGVAKGLRNAERHVFQTGFKFQWKIDSGTYNIIDTEELRQIDPYDVGKYESLSHVWNPAQQAVRHLQQQWYIPHAHARSVNVLTNEAVFQGTSKKVIWAPAHHLAIVL